MKVERAKSHAKETQGCTFRPYVSPRSKKLAKKHKSSIKDSEKIARKDFAPLMRK